MRQQRQQGKVTLLTNMLHGLSTMPSTPTRPCHQDGTLVVTKSGMQFPKDGDDWQWFNANVSAAGGRVCHTDNCEGLASWLLRECGAAWLGRLLQALRAGPETDSPSPHSPALLSHRTLCRCRASCGNWCLRGTSWSSSGTAGSTRWTVPSKVAPAALLLHSPLMQGACKRSASLAS